MFCEGNPLGRRIDYVFANAPISTITSFHLDTDSPIPTHRPLVFTIAVNLFFHFHLSIFSSTHMLYDIPTPPAHFLHALQHVFQWDISQLVTMSMLFLSVGMLGRNSILRCLRSKIFILEDRIPVLNEEKLPSLPTKRHQLQTARILFFTTLLFLLLLKYYVTLQCKLHIVVRGIFNAFVNPLLPFFTLFPSFHFDVQTIDWLQNLRQQLVGHRLTGQRDVSLQRQKAWRAWIKDTWALNSKNIQGQTGRTLHFFTTSGSTYHKPCSY